MATPKQCSLCRAQRLKIVHVVGNKPDDPAPAGWESTPTYTAETGWIDEAKIAKYAFPPAEDTLLFVCGLPPMYRCTARRVRCSTPCVCACVRACVRGRVRASCSALRCYASRGGAAVAVCSSWCSCRRCTPPACACTFQHPMRAAHREGAVGGHRA